MVWRSTARSTSTTTTSRTPAGRSTSASTSPTTCRAASMRLACGPEATRSTSPSWSPDFIKWAPGNVLERLTERDRYMQEHRLLSLYDFHSDGTGTCYSSLRRPLLSLRPGYDMPLISAPHQFNADLHLLDWLEQK